MLDIFLRNPKAIVFSVLIHVVLLGLIVVEMLSEPQKNMPLVQNEVTTIKAKAINASDIEKQIKAKNQKELNKKQAIDEKKNRVEARKKVEKKKNELAKKAKELKKKQQDAKKKAAKEKARIKKQKNKEKKAEKERLKHVAEKRRKEQKRLKTEKLTRKKEKEEAAKKEKLEKERLDAERKKKTAEKERIDLENKKQEDIRLAAEKEQKQKVMELQFQMAAEERQRELSDFKLQYLSAIQQKIQRNWRQPVNAGKMPNCEVNVLQGPSGVILDVTFGRCPGTTNYRLSVENAVYKSEPLPEPKDSSLFDRDVKILFKPNN